MKLKSNTHSGIVLPKVSRLYDELNDVDVVLVSVEKTGNRGRMVQVIDMDTFQSPSRLDGELRKAGADPKQYRVQDLINSLPDKAGALRRKTGWVECGDERRYLLYDAIVQLDAERLLFLDMNAGDEGISIGQSKGTFDEWKRYVAGPMVKSKPTLVTMCAALAGPLLYDAGLPETMVINFCAKTSTGKTTMIRGAASVFNNPDEVPGWRVSDTKLDEVAVYFNDNTLILDDIETTTGSLQRRMENAYEVVHTLTAGRPKGISRMAIGAGSRERYCCIALSSSPSPIFWVLAGHVELQDSDRVRLFDLPIPETKFGIWDPSVILDKDRSPLNRQQTEALAQDAASFYGTAGKVWVDYLTAHQAEIPMHIAEIIEKFVRSCKTDEPKKNRIARKIGVLKAAGVLAVEADILPCTRLDVQKSCCWAYQEIVKTAFGHELTLETIMEHISDQLEFETFPSHTQAEISSNADLKKIDGFINEGNHKLIMTTKGFDRLCEGLLPSNPAAGERMVVHIWKTLMEHGVYLTDGRGNHVQSVNIAGNGQRRCVLDLAQFAKAYKEISQEQSEETAPSEAKFAKRKRRKGKKSKPSTASHTKSGKSARPNSASAKMKSSRWKRK
ncbi:MAG: DUF927 domain-containing protein [Cohaesibacter sp.]|nr:DUF927 domain-containing protein [Cohaesibacter sp.]